MEVVVAVIAVIVVDMDVIAAPGDALAPTVHSRP
jgi:hypothetical protein